MLDLGDVIAAPVSASKALHLRLGIRTTQWKLGMSLIIAQVETHSASDVYPPAQLVTVVAKPASVGM